MSLLPMMLTHIAARGAVTADAGVTNRYNSGTAYRPLAALVAVGVPAALLLAVALSPFELPRVIKDSGTIFIPLTAPKPPPPPPTADPQPETQPQSQLTAPQTPFRSLADDPVQVAQDDAIPDPVADPLAGDQIKPITVESVPVDPPLISARLDPRYAAGFQPDYPASEQRREIEGTARVRVLVGTDGRVKAVEDIASTSPGFFAETRRQALSKWRFKPAMRGGVAEESWFTITVRFQLNS